jgi:predicted RNase H-like HicB family nuclease
METGSVAYSLAIERHPDGYLAYFPALPGCHSWGGTLEEAMKNAEEAVAGYIEALVAKGKPVPVEHPKSPTSFGLVVEVPTIV